jgi:hypothetical protein
LTFIPNCVIIIITREEIIKMYRIKVKNTETNIVYYEYGFSKWIMKRLHFYFNETDNNYYSIYEILDIAILNFTFKTFKKCLFNETKIIKR